MTDGSGENVFRSDRLGRVAVPKAPMTPDLSCRGYPPAQRGTEQKKMSSGKKAKRLLALEAKAKSKAQVGSKRAGGELEGAATLSRARAKTSDGRKNGPPGGVVGQGTDRSHRQRSGMVRAGSMGTTDGVTRNDAGDVVDVRFVDESRCQGLAGSGTLKSKGKGRDQRGDSLDSERLELLYAPFEEVDEVFDWAEGGVSESRSVHGVIRSLLGTNQRYNKQSAAASSGVVDKMKEKTLLLENPTGQKGSRNNRQGMFYGPPGVRMASRKVLQGMVGEAVSYEDAMVLHGLWRGYRDEVMGEPTANKQEEMERVWGLERCGAMVEVVWPSSVGGKPVKGIVIKDSDRSMHVIEESGVVRVVDKSSGCVVSMQVSHGRLARSVFG